MDFSQYLTNAQIATALVMIAFVAVIILFKKEPPKKPKAKK